MTNAPAGWYPDPEFPGQQRYWDGREWTVNRAPAASAPVPAPSAVTAPPAHPAPSSPAPQNTTGTSLAVLALALAILGFVLGVFPFGAWFAWLLFVPALVLAIRALVKRWAGRGQAIAAVAIVATGWLISLVVGLASFGMIGSSDTGPDAAADPAAVATPTPSPAGTAPAPASPTPTPVPTQSAPPASPGIGQTVTSRSGVSFRVAAVACGLGAQEYAFGSVAPKGQFCRVDFVVANGGSQPQDVSTYDVFGYIGNARYEADTSLGTFGDDMFSTTVNPGLAVNCTVFFDVPAGATLDRVKLITSWWGGDGATVSLR